MRPAGVSSACTDNPSQSCPSPVSPRVQFASGSEPEPVASTVRPDYMVPHFIAHLRLEWRSLALVLSFLALRGKAAQKKWAGANTPPSARTFRRANQPASMTSWRLRCARSDVVILELRSLRALISVNCWGCPCGARSHPHICRLTQRRRGPHPHRRLRAVLIPLSALGAQRRPAAILLPGCGAIRRSEAEGSGLRLMDLSLAFGIGLVGLIYILLLFTFSWVIGIRLGPRG